MTTFFKDPESNKILHEFIHHNFARKAGLMAHEFMVHFDQSLQYAGSDVDYIISAGKAVHIALRCLPNSENFTRLLRLVFNQDLRPFIRRMALVKREETRWQTLAVKLPEAEYKVKKRGIHFTQEVTTSIKLIDRKSKKVIVVEVVNGDAFSAQELALKQLYGERYE